MIATRLVESRACAPTPKLGFETIHTCRDAEDESAVVAWDWRDP